VNNVDIIGIGYMGFETPNLEAWREYGPQVMGFGIGKNPESDPESLYFKIDDRRHRFAFHPGKVDRIAYIGWEAVGRMAFEDGIRKLAAANVEYTRGDAQLCEKRGVRELVRFRDPVGYQHELFYGQKWLPRSFQPGRPHSGFLADERGAVHGAGAGKGRTGFFRSKLNHHTSHDIAYGHGPGRMGVQHVGLFVRNVRDVGETYDIVRQRELPMMMTLGQHAQDPHLSFYHFNPSGFAFETIAEIEPWQGDPYELNPEKLSLWGHEMVGPILGASVKTPEEVLDAEYLPIYLAKH
jgi:hypothetical protein